jgi:hypothetical protein
MRGLKLGGDALCGAVITRVTHGADVHKLKRMCNDREVSGLFSDISENILLAFYL